MATALSRAFGFVVISSDVVRKKLANIPVTEHRYTAFNRDIYSEDFTRKTYAEMFNQARQALVKGQWVILDASFKKRQDRISARSLAHEVNADFFVAECVLEEAAVKRRLEGRLRGGSVSDGRWETYEVQKREFDPITEIPTEEHVMVDTSCSISGSIKRISEKVA